MAGATQTADGARQESRFSVITRLARGELGSLRVFLTIALIWVIFQFENDRFLSAINLTNLTLQIAAIGLISVGVVLVLLLGEIDLSVGAVSGLAAGVMAVLQVKHGWSPELAFLAGLATAPHRFLQRVHDHPVRDSFVRRDPCGLLAWQGALERCSETPDDQPYRQVRIDFAFTFYPPSWAAPSHCSQRVTGFRAAGVAPAAEGGRGARTDHRSHPDCDPRCRDFAAVSILN